MFESKLFRALTCIFTAVSAYMTLQYTLTLANNNFEEVAYAALGVAFDLTKCFLPAAFLRLFAKGGRSNIAQALLLVTIYLLLTGFSALASLNATNNSALVAAQDKIRATAEYQALERKRNNAQTSYDRLQALDRISQANREYSPTIDETSAKMAAMLDTAEISAKDELVTWIVTLLLELATLGCHICVRVFSVTGVTHVTHVTHVTDDVTQNVTGVTGVTQNVTGVTGVTGVTQDVTQNVTGVTGVTDDVTHDVTRVTHDVTTPLLTGFVDNDAVTLPVTSEIKNVTGMPCSNVWGSQMSNVEIADAIASNKLKHTVKAIRNAFGVGTNRAMQIRNLILGVSNVDTKDKVISIYRNS